MHPAPTWRALAIARLSQSATTRLPPLGAHCSAGRGRHRGGLVRRSKADQLGQGRLAYLSPDRSSLCSTGLTPPTSMAAQSFVVCAWDQGF